MIRSWKSWVAAALGAAASWGATPSAHPGTLNYIEGQAAIDGRTVTSQSLGSMSVEPGQVLSTQNGRAEMLLTPGVFLRLGQRSAVRMVSPGLTDTRVQVLQGQAMVEATNLHHENHIELLDKRARVELLKNGVYDVDGNRDVVAVYDGKALVSADDRQVEVKGGREVNLNVPLKAEKFDKKESENHDPLYQWSKVRSEYLAEANASLAPYVVNGPGWYGSGWYWDPWWHTWSFVPAAGFFGSPFGGWGFYSPWALYGGYYAPRYYYRPRVVVPGRIGGVYRQGISPGVARGGISGFPARQGGIGGGRHR